PPASGRGRFFRFARGDFFGRAPLLRQRERGVERSLACLVVDADGADAHGYEPVLADGRAVGYVASGGFGHVLEKSIVLAYLPVAHAVPGTELEVEILGERRRSTVAAQPLYDPHNERLLS